MIELDIYGRIPSKKNSKQILINSKTKKQFVSSSKKYKEWENIAIKTLKDQFKKYNETTIDCAYVAIDIRFPDRRKSDLTNKAESIMDALVLAGIITDDCYNVVQKLNLTGSLNKENPGAKIKIHVVCMNSIINLRQGEKL